MAQYKIDFRSFNNDRYEVAIYPSNETYNSQTATPLTGGASPISTEMEASDDVLTSVRPGTGTLRIVTSDYSLMSNLMPTDPDETRVTLIRHPRADEASQVSRIMWDGYIKPEAYTQEWSAGPWEIEIPIQDRVSMIMDSYLSDANSPLLSIAGFLKRICGNVLTEVLVPYSDIMKRGTMQWGTTSTGAKTPTVTTPTILECAFNENQFKKKIDTQDRANIQDTTNGIWEPGTNRDIADSICHMLGWCIYQWGNKLVCFDVARHTYEYKTILASQLTNFSKTQTIPLQAQSTNVSYLDLEKLMDGELIDEDGDGLQISDTTGTRGFIQPYGRITVTGSQEECSETVIETGNTEWQEAGKLPPINGAPTSANWPDGIPWKSDTNANIRTQIVCYHPEVTYYHHYAKKIGSHTIGQDFTNTQGKYSSLLYKNIHPEIIDSNSGDYDQHGTDNGSQHFAGGEIVGWGIGSSILQDPLKNKAIILCAFKKEDGMSKKGVTIKSSNAFALSLCTREIKYVALCISGTVMRNNKDEGIKDILLNTGHEDEDVFYSVRVSVKFGDVYLYYDSLNTNKTIIKNTELPFDIVFTNLDNNKFEVQLKLTYGDYKKLSLLGPLEVTLWTPLSNESKGIKNDCIYQKITDFKVEIKQTDYLDNYNKSLTYIETPKSTIEFDNKLGANKREEYTLETKFSSYDGPLALLCGFPLDMTIQGVSCTDQEYFPVRKVGQLNKGGDGARQLCEIVYDYMYELGAVTRQKLSIPIRYTMPWAYLPAIISSGLDYACMITNRQMEWADDNCTLSMTQYSV